MLQKYSWATRVICTAVACASVASATMADQPLMGTWTSILESSAAHESLSVAMNTSSAAAYVTGLAYDPLADPNGLEGRAFLAKFDTDGIELWRHQFGVGTYDAGRAVAVTGSGAVYVAGNSCDSIGGLSTGCRDSFLIKFDADGNELWRHQFGTGTEDVCNSMAVDALGAAYITGWTDGDLAGANAGRYDIFLVKFDADGNELWRRQFGTSDSECTGSVAVNALGSACVTGRTWGSFAAPMLSGPDTFLFKFDTNGNELWRRQFTEDWCAQAEAVTFDAVGSIYVAGRTDHKRDDDFYVCDHDAYLMKLDADGNILWQQTVGTKNYEIGRSVAVDASGAAYLAGDTCGALAGQFAEFTDIFLTKFDAAGNQLWTRQRNVGGVDACTSLAVVQTGIACLTGYSQEWLGPNNLAPRETFLVKYNVEGIPGCIDGDGDVDLDDFVILKTNFGHTTATRGEGDLDGDGDVDLDDFGILKNNFGSGS